jgi:hypothetical protein
VGALDHDYPTDHEGLDQGADAVDALLRVDDLDDDREALGRHLDGARVDVVVVTEPGDAFHQGGAREALVAEQLEEAAEQRLAIVSP